MTAYYNEIDPYAAQWLRNLIAAGHIAPGDVDERSIVDVRPDDLRGYRQCHFFAGVGIWSYALRQAGWSDEREVWTGSCPCQPFSDAGARDGFQDSRHLWPIWFELVRECRPVVVFGEQVASKDGLAWLDAVHADLEAETYAVGAVDTCAAGFGAPHIRQRFFFVADAGRDGTWQHARELPRDEGEHDERAARGAHGAGWTPGGLADADGRNERDGSIQRSGEHGLFAQDRGATVEDGRPGPVNGHWRSADWLFCTDGKWRPVEPSTFPLVDGTPARLVRLRGYGNGINAEVATAFIEAYQDVRQAT